MTDDSPSWFVYNGNVDVDLLALPGGDLIMRGLEDLAAGVESAPALVVAIGAPRLQALGLRVERRIEAPEHRLYGMLALEDNDSAHSRYNALVRRLVSFERSLACVR